MSQERKKPSPARSIIAGGIAGGIEAAVTYPAEFTKTRLQLNRTLPHELKQPLPPFGLQYYVGCSSLVAGNTLKAAIRFLSFDTFKHLLSDETGHITGPRTVLAGLGAGVCESIFAVAPFESIKTSLIDDKKRAVPQYRGLVHGAQSILAERGIRGIYQGLMPTLARQAANSAVRFWSYSTIRQAIQGSLAPGEKLSSLSTFGIGATAGFITVYATMPLVRASLRCELIAQDTVKTRMQSINAKKEYGNSFKCIWKIYKQEGILAFWSGATPRLARLLLSGGIVFTVYEKVIEMFDYVDPQGRYI